MSDTIEARLTARGITLPVAAAPAANYVPYVISGALLTISGQLPMENGAVAVTGHLGDTVDVASGQRAAELCAINILAQAKPRSAAICRASAGSSAERLRREQAELHRTTSGHQRRLQPDRRNPWRCRQACARRGRHGRPSLQRRGRDRRGDRDRLRPRADDRPVLAHSQPIAHRGYHDMNKTVWENTLSAFERAISAGYAIECDLQYTADSVPVVFHDGDMHRLCGVEGDVRAKTAGELGLFSIGGTSDRVPTLSQLLRLVKGRVPLVIELKAGRANDEGFAEAVLDGLEGYAGPVALMSFDHWLLKDLKALETTLPVGLTAEAHVRRISLFMLTPCRWVSISSPITTAICRIPSSRPSGRRGARSSPGRSGMRRREPIAMRRPTRSPSRGSYRRAGPLPDRVRRNR